jgi:hypothetical protein
MCGAVRYSVDGQPMMIALCHCSMCRRAVGAPAVAWAMFTKEQVQIKGAIKQYTSSPGVQRQFCGVCGTSLAFTADYIEGLIDITVASFDQPEALPPMFQYWESRRLPWFRRDDALPSHAEFPPMS